MKTLKILLLATLSLFIFVTCKKDNVCPTCVNGGECVNGVCQCPEGFEGSTCADQRTPLKMHILSVKVTRFPSLDNGSNWDLLDGPDIFFQFFDDNALLYEQPNFIEDADPTQDYDLNVTTPIEIDDVLATHVIQLLDYDDGITSDDFMGGIQFTPYFGTTNGFPTTIELDAGEKVAFTLTVSYTF